MKMSHYDIVSKKLTKYPKVPFSGNLKEKAYLLGLRCGDLSTQKHGRNIRVSTASTHPAMLELFKNIFSNYGKIGQYPKYNKSFNRHYWRVYCDLDKSFGFLFQKETKIPKWVINEDKLFFNFLSGYFDADGCLSVCMDSRGNKNVQMIVKSYDKDILRDIVDNMNRLGFELNIKIAKKADNVSYRKDYWYIGTGRKNQILSILKRMNLKHKEKLLKYELLKELESTEWKDAKIKILNLRNSIKEGVKICVENSKLYCTS